MEVGPYWKRLPRIIERLPLIMESEHFRLRYGLRNPACGKGLGASGVADRSLPLTYLHALEKLYRTMSAAPWGRPAAITDATGKTPVYIFEISELMPGDSSPFIHANAEKIPFICLPSRSSEPSAQSEMQCAAAQAIHEATHVFNFREQVTRHGDRRRWHWLDDGLAVFMETHLIPGNHDHFRFLKNWLDEPELPLDHRWAGYQAGLFVAYLEAQQQGLANKTWLQDGRAGGPVETLMGLLPLGRKFVSHHPDERDLFASGYCLDSYFFWDHTCASLAPELFARFGERAVTESFALRPGFADVSPNHRLDHLACRYFRFYLKAEVSHLQIELRAEGEQPIAPLKAELAVVKPEMQRGDVVALRSKSAGGELSDRILSVELNQLAPNHLDHLVLVVTNCGTRAAQPNTTISSDDNRRFAVAVAAQ